MISELNKRILSSLIIIPLSLFFIIKGSYIFNLFLIICFFITCYEWFKMSQNKKYHLFGYLFLLLSFYSAFSLRNKFYDESLIYFLFVIIVCVSTDIGGYIFGKIFKGPRLTKISPQKTYSGMFGGYLLSIIIILFLINYTYLINYKNSFSIINILLLLMLVSTISQIGDIVISFFKRSSKLKDTGNIIPGHGGLLDRIDGIIFAIPFSYLIFLSIY